MHQPCHLHPLVFQAEQGQLMVHEQREDKRDPLEKRASRCALFSISLLILNTDSEPGGHGSFREIVNWGKKV